MAWDRKNWVGEGGDPGEGPHPALALLMSLRIFPRLLAAGSRAVIDFLIEDLCLLCGAAPVSCSAKEDTQTGYASHFRQPVTGARTGFGAIVNHPVCERCRNRFVMARATGGLPVLGDCSTSVPIPVVAPFMIDDNTLKIIHLIKFRGYRELAAPVAGCIHAAYDEFGRGTDASSVLVPTPMEAGELRVRGFNLPTLVGRRLQKAFDIPLVENALRKVRKTARQSQTPHEARPGNVRGAFVCTGSQLAGRRVLLIDDLVTTGATAASCARAIVTSGPASLEVLCFARAL